MIKTALGLALGLSLYGSITASSVWTPAQWFLASEQGAAYWITPDFVGLYQDSAGTIPVTAVEQSVGMVLDRKAGLVRGPEEILDPGFDDTTKWTKTPPWSVSGGVATHNGSSADYIYTATEVPIVGEWYEVVFVIDSIAAGVISLYVGQTPAAYNATTAGTHRCITRCQGTGLKFSLRSSNASGGNTVISSFSAKKLPGNHLTQATTASKPKLTARNNLLLATTTLSTQSVTCTATPYTLSFKGTGTVTLSGASTAGPLVGTGAGNRVSLTFTPSAGSVTFTVSGSVTEAQLEYGSAFTRYQRVTTATDYDTVGFPHRLKFDGFDDFLSTPGNVDFSAVDVAVVVMGITKFVDTPQGYVVSFGTDPSSTPGFYLTAPAFGGGAGWGGGSRGSALASNNNAPNSPGHQKRVITLDARISTDRFKVRQDGVEITTATSDQGAGNYGSKQVFVGRGFGGTSGSANVEISSLVIRGAQTADLTPGEAFAANLHGVTLP